MTPARAAGPRWVNGRDPRGCLDFGLWPEAVLAKLYAIARLGVTAVGREPGGFRGRPGTAASAPIVRVRTASSNGNGRLTRPSPSRGPGAAIFVWDESRFPTAAKVRGHEGACAGNAVVQRRATTLRPASRPPNRTFWFCAYDGALIGNLRHVVDQLMKYGATRFIWYSIACQHTRRRWCVSMWPPPKAS